MGAGRTRSAVAAAVLALLASCSGDGPSKSNGGFDFSKWHPGDVHVHAAGDGDLINHPRCRDGGAATPEACGRALVSIMSQAARSAGLEWMILTEHGVWLGGVVRYSERQAAAQWDALRQAARIGSGGGVRVLMGQEQATFQLGGHFNTYFQREVIHQRSTDFDEVGYIDRAQRAGAWGAINHPDHARNPWTCWDDFIDTPKAKDECTRRATRNNHPPVAEAYAQRWGVDDSSTTLRAIEITNNAVPPSVETLAVWDRLLERGYLIGATGASDAHTVSRSHVIAKPTEGRIGNSRTFAFVDGSIRAGEGFDATDPDDPIRRALFEGRTVASTGFLAVPQILNALPGDTVGAGDAEELPLTIWLKADPADAPGSMTVVVVPVMGACGGSCKTGRVTRQITSREWSAGKVPVIVRMPADVRRAAVRIEASVEGGQRAAWSSPIYVERV